GLFISVIMSANLRCDGETRRHWQANPAHLRKTGALPTQKSALTPLAFRFASSEKIDPFSHSVPRLSFLNFENRPATALLYGDWKNCRHADPSHLSQLKAKLYLPYLRSSPPNSEKSAMVVNSLRISESKARRFFRTASFSAITITPSKKSSTALRSPAMTSSAS